MLRKQARGLNLFEFAIARTYFQLLEKSSLADKETQLLLRLTPSVEAYEARETPPLEAHGAAE